MPRRMPSASLTAIVMVLPMVAGLTTKTPAAADRAQVLPMPATDLPSGPATSATLVVAGGCFWGVQGVFRHVNGVTAAVSGYAGGEKKTAAYDRVGSGTTGHAEAVQIIYDPRRISCGRLLHILLGGPRSDAAQSAGAGHRTTVSLGHLSGQRRAGGRGEELHRPAQSGVRLQNAIVTTIESDRAFYPAEDYHQDYLTRNPRGRRLPQSFRDVRSYCFRMNATCRRICCVGTGKSERHPSPDHRRQAPQSPGFNSGGSSAR